MLIGVSTWVWASPCDDGTVAELAPRVAEWGFDVLELPVEQLGDWDPVKTARVLDGEQLPKEWVLPQPTITQENLDDYIQPNMPPLHYALCGCQQMPGFPQRWGGGQ